MGVTLPYLVVAAVLAFCPQPTLAQNVISTGGPSCSEHPAEALQCAFTNGTTVGTPCLTDTGVLCCTVASDCKAPSSSSSGSVVGSSSTSSAAASQNTGIYEVAGPSCMPRSAAYSPQCIPDVYINGTLDPSLDTGLGACFTRQGTYCCKDDKDCKSEKDVFSASSSGTASSSKPIGSATSSACASSTNPVGAGPSKATTSNSMPKFTNEAVAGNGIAAAAVAGVLGAAVAFI